MADKYTQPKVRLIKSPWEAALEGSVENAFQDQHTAPSPTPRGNVMIAPSPSSFSKMMTPPPPQSFVSSNDIYAKPPKAWHPQPTGKQLSSVNLEQIFEGSPRSPVSLAYHPDTNTLSTEPVPVENIPPIAVKLYDYEIIDPSILRDQPPRRPDEVLADVHSVQSKNKVLKSQCGGKWPPTNQEHDIVGWNPNIANWAKTSQGSTQPAATQQNQPTQPMVQQPTHTQPAMQQQNHSQPMMQQPINTAQPMMQQQNYSQPMVMQQNPQPQPSTMVQFQPSEIQQSQAPQPVVMTQRNAPPQHLNLQRPTMQKQALVSPTAPKQRVTWPPPLFMGNEEDFEQSSQTSQQPPPVQQPSHPQHQAPMFPQAASVLGKQIEQLQQTSSHESSMQNTLQQSLSEIQSAMTQACQNFTRFESESTNIQTSKKEEIFLQQSKSEVIEKESKIEAIQMQSSELRQENVMQSVNGLSLVNEIKNQSEKFNEKKINEVHMSGESITASGCIKPDQEISNVKEGELNATDSNSVAPNLVAEVPLAEEPVAMAPSVTEKVAVVPPSIEPSIMAPLATEPPIPNALEESQIPNEPVSAEQLSTEQVVKPLQEVTDPKIMINTVNPINEIPHQPEINQEVMPQEQNSKLSYNVHEMKLAEMCNQALFQNGHLDTSIPSQMQAKTIESNGSEFKNVQKFEESVQSSNINFIKEEMNTSNQQISQSKMSESVLEKSHVQESTISSNKISETLSSQTMNGISQASLMNNRSISSFQESQMMSSLNKTQFKSVQENQFMEASNRTSMSVMSTTDEEVQDLCEREFNQISMQYEKMDKPQIKKPAAIIPGAVKVFPSGNDFTAVPKPVTNSVQPNKTETQPEVIKCDPSLKKTYKKPPSMVPGARPLFGEAVELHLGQGGTETDRPYEQIPVKNLIKTFEESTRPHMRYKTKTPDTSHFTNPPQEQEPAQQLVQRTSLYATFPDDIPSQGDIIKSQPEYTLPTQQPASQPMPTPQPLPTQQSQPSSTPSNLYVDLKVVSNFNTAPRGWQSNMSYYRPVTFTTDTNQYTDF